MLNANTRLIFSAICMSFAFHTFIRIRRAFLNSPRAASTRSTAQYRGVIYIFAICVERLRARHIFLYRRRVLCAESYKVAKTFSKARKMSSKSQNLSRICCGSRRIVRSPMERAKVIRNMHNNRCRMGYRCILLPVLIKAHRTACTNKEDNPFFYA